MKKILTTAAAMAAIAAGTAGAETRSQYIADRCTPEIVQMSRDAGLPGGMSECVADRGYTWDLRSRIAAANAYLEPYRDCMRARTHPLRPPSHGTIAYCERVQINSMRRR